MPGTYSLSVADRLSGATGEPCARTLYAKDCATPNPRLVRVQDPFGNLLAKAKGSVLISPRDIFQASA